MVSLASGSDSLKVWNFENENLNLLSNFGTSTGSCTCLAWNHTNQVVASGGADNRIYLIQANNGQVLSSLQVAEENSGKSDANAVAFSNNSRFLAAALGNHLQFWDLKRRQMKSVMTDHRDTISACCFLPTGDIISGDVSGAVRIWDSKAYLSSPELVTSSSASAGVTSLSISPLSAAQLATGYTDGYLGVWDTETFKLLRRQQCHRGSLNSVTSSPRNPRLVVTGGSDYRVALVDTAARSAAEPSAAIEITDRTNITAVSFHEDAIHTAVGLGNGNVVIYDWRKMKQPVISITAHEYGPVLAMSFQVPKVNKGSEESATSGARTSRASSISTAPSVMASTEKKIPATPPRVPAASTAQASSAVTSANINSTTVGVAPPAATYVRASIDSSAAAGGTHQGIGRSERGSKSPETSSLRRLNNVTSPAGSTSINLGNSSSANLPTPPAVSVAVASNQSTAAPRDRQTPPSAPSMSEHSSGANSGADNNKSAAVAASLDRSVARQYEPSAILKASLPPSTVRSSSDRAPAAMSSLPPPQQLEVSFDRSVDAVHRAVADSGRGSGEPSRHSRSAHDLHKSHHHQHPDLNESNDKTAPSSASAVSSHKGSAHKAHRASADIGHHTSSAQETRGVGASETQEEDFSEQPFAGLRHALKPVTAKDLEESLQLLRYDIHREVQDVIREQIRQFSIAKDDTAELLRELSTQMAELLQANRELRAENEYLRRIY